MLYISSSCVSSDNIISSIKLLSKITKNIELSGGTNDSKVTSGQLKKLKIENNLNFLIHNYFPPPENSFVLNFADTSDLTRNFIAKSLEFCNSLNVPYYSIHSGFKRDILLKNEEMLVQNKEYSFEGIKKNLNWYFDNFNKELALENLFQNSNVKKCFGSSIKDIENLLSLDDRVNLLLDLGHLKISSKYYNTNYEKDVELLFTKYSDRILEIHLSENNGYEDNHLSIDSDSIQYNIFRYRF